MKADGSEFDAVAADYNRHRGTYPDALVDAACGRGGLTAGSRVLEIGCGTGQLTEALARRGLVVEAVETGAQLVEHARRRLGGDTVRFHLARFEDVALPEGAYDAVFSATAFHWIDPSVGWAKAARLLKPAGMLALLQTGVGSPLTPLFHDMVAAWREVRGAESHWTQLEPFELWDGVRRAQGNVSEAWSLISRHSLARAGAADLFDAVQILGVPTPSEYTADAYVARTRTTSTYQRLDAKRRSRLEDRIRQAIERAGGRACFADWAVLLTAQRR